MKSKNPTCPDCDQDMTRRDFGRLAVAAGATPLLSTSLVAATGSMHDTAVTKLYATLSDQQKKVICFPFEHGLRQRINANWKITEPRIEDDFYTEEQRRLIDEIYRSVTSEDGHELFQRQLQEDSGGFRRNHVALFGEPGSKNFECEITGRHLTIRAPGDHANSASFGGPTIYGHGETDPKKNLFHYQTQKANEVFASLDGKQRSVALVTDAPPEARVELREGEFPGIAVGELSQDHRRLVRSAIQTILAPYHQDRVDGAMAAARAGSIDKLHIAFYRTGDLGNDEIWDIWRVEGPNLVWHFRGAPHVHAYINIRTPQSTG